MSEREVGVVDMWRTSYGFIRPNAKTKDIFCHYSALTMDGFKQLHVGQRVSFTRAVGDDGRTQAVDVRLEADVTD